MSAQPWYAAVPRSTRHHILAGMVITGVAVLGFSAWSATAPIAGAIITSGAFVASGQNKTIQHLEGGVIREIKVHEGDIVEAGQTLVVLDDTTPKAELRRLTLKLARLEAVEARLKAEAQAREKAARKHAAKEDAKAKAKAKADANARSDAEKTKGSKR